MNIINSFRNVVLDSSARIGTGFRFYISLLRSKRRRNRWQLLLSPSVARFQERWQLQRSAIDFFTLTAHTHTRQDIVYNRIVRYIARNGRLQPMVAHPGKVIHHIQKLSKYIQKYQRPEPTPSKYPSVVVIVGGVVCCQIDPWN